MSYSEITFRDRNPIKRWLQQQRLISAIKLCSHLPRVHQNILDFGAGNGELLKILYNYYSASEFICYEPTPDLLSEAKRNLNTVSGVKFCENLEYIASESLDMIFCLEVFEHLPPKETTEAFKKIHALLKPGGNVIIGVPVEIGIPALYKGLFRMTRRYGAFDANIKNIGLAFFGYPPKNRPSSEIAPGLRFHFEHMSFNFRRFKQIFRHYFDLQKTSSSPFSVLGPALMPEIYFIGKKANNS